METENDKIQNEYPLADLLGSSSLEFINRLTSKDYRRTPKRKTKIIRAKSSMTTFQLKLLMEEVPKGELHGR